MLLLGTFKERFDTIDGGVDLFQRFRVASHPPIEDAQSDESCCGRKKRIIRHRQRQTSRNGKERRRRREGVKQEQGVQASWKESGEKQFRWSDEQHCE